MDFFFLKGIEKKLDYLNISFCSLFGMFINLVCLYFEFFVFLKN